MGVEEELMIIDPVTFDLFPGVQRIRARATSYDLPGPVKTELHASIFELNTPPCATAHEAAASLTALRTGIAEVVAAEGDDADGLPVQQGLTVAVDDRRQQRFVFAELERAALPELGMQKRRGPADFPVLTDFGGDSRCVVPEFASGSE